jgi:signal transduction histidine kinase
MESSCKRNGIDEGAMYLGSRFRIGLFLLLLLFGPHRLAAQNETQNKQAQNEAAANPQPQASEIEVYELLKTYWFKRDLINARKYINIFLAQKPNFADSVNLVDVYIILANIHLTQSVYDSALFALNSGRLIQRQISDPKHLGSLFSTSGDIYKRLGDYNRALSDLCTADSLFGISKDKAVQQNRVWTLIAIGSMYDQLRNWQQSLYYYKRAQVLADKDTFLAPRMAARQYIGRTYFEERRYKEAAAVFENLQTTKLFDTSIYLSIYTLEGMGDVQYALGNVDAAIVNYLFELRLLYKYSELLQISAVHLKLARAYNRLNDEASYSRHLDSTRYWAGINRDINVAIQVLELTIDDAEKQGNYKQAYSNQILLTKLKDSVVKQQYLEQAQKLEVLNKVKDKDAEILVLNKTVGLNSKVIARDKAIKYLLASLAVACVILFYILYKSRRQKNIAAMQRAVFDERTRIASEMHDDLGSGLTSIKLLSDITLQKGSSNDSSELRKINTNAGILVARMRELVWTLNPENDSLSNTIYFIKEYAVDFLTEADIDVQFNETLPAELRASTLTGTKRRDIILIVKECLNNIVKHAKASQVQIDTNISDNILQITITDNGVGLSNEKPQQLGHGLASMRTRATRHGGSFALKRLNQLTFAEIRIPFANNT